MEITRPISCLSSSKCQGATEVLTKISKIKGLGVYDDYSPPRDLRAFGTRNIFYGWNYSGKTTLSRIFSLLEHKVPNPELSDFNFTIESTDGPITDKNYQLSKQEVRVFNADFIANNLNFAGTTFKPILLLGQDAETAQTQIDLLTASIGRCVINRSNKKNLREQKKQTFDKAKTEAAAAIKKQLGIVSAYTSAHLDRDVGAVRNSTAEHILSQEDLESYLRLALTSDNEQLPDISAWNPDLQLTSLTEATSKILKVVPDLKGTIEHLISSPSIESWVEQGLPLHSEGDDCEFCGGKLEESRYKELLKHFSKELGDHKRQLKILTGKINSAKLTPPQTKELEINSQYRLKFSNAKEQINLALTDYNHCLDELSLVVDEKHSDPFVEKHIVEALLSLAEAAAANISDSSALLNEVITLNNALNAEFSERKIEAIDYVRKHLVCDFVNIQNQISYDALQSLLGKQEKKYDTLITQLETKVSELKSLISKAQLGREKINSRIETLLGGNCVQIKVTKVGEEERFQLIRRSGQIARHLSEGEKTAIAFSFFLTKLDELKCLNDTIVYIDDPISSLDSNHIFQVVAIIKDVFFFKDKADDQWKTTCKQLFISTHNFEFLYLVKELKLSGKNSTSNYLIKRTSPQQSSILDMPKSLLQYQSEYHFLYTVLRDFHESADKSNFEVLMLLPNAVRRFLELYTYSKIPGTGSVDERADKLFGNEKSKRLLKVFHFFSHGNTIERMAGNSDLLCDIEGAIDDLMELLEQDTLHFEALDSARG